MESTNSGYLPRLDHLRFVAALAVFTWHGLHYNLALPFISIPQFFPASFFEEGHTGVSLFLTLSGFILAAICTGRDVIYASFIRNRLLRLMPLLLTWTLAWFYTSNIAPERLFAMLFGLLVNGGQFPGAGWTVLIEFQFYLLFPFLLIFIERYGLRYVAGLLAIAVMIRLLFFLRFGTVQVLAYSTAFGRIDQFLLGICAFHLYRRGHLPRSPWFLLALVTLWLFIYHQFNRLGGYWNPGRPEIWVFFPTLEGLFYGLITATYLRARITIPRVIDRPAAWLGKISYSLYLNHDAVIIATALCATRLGFPYTNLHNAALLTFMVALPILIAFSAVTYYVIEEPFLKLRRPYLAVRPAPAAHVLEPKQRAAS